VGREGGAVIGGPLYVAQIQLPGFQGVLDAFNDLLMSDLFSNYLFWYLAIGLVGFLVYVVISTFRR
jgi:hypothetical protein